MVMETVSWIMVGLATGALARVAMPGPAAGGMLVGVSIGLIGALIGGFLGATFLRDASAHFDFNSVMMAANGSIYPLFIYRCLAMRLREPIQTPAENQLPKIVSHGGQMGRVVSDSSAFPNPGASEI